MILNKCKILLAIDTYVVLNTLDDQLKYVLKKTINTRSLKYKIDDFKEHSNLDINFLVYILIIFSCAVPFLFNRRIHFTIPII